MILTSANNSRVGSKENVFNMIRILSKRKGLNICHINAQSLNNKMDEFKFIFEESGIDVICISETWFHADVHNNFYILEGYRLFRSDRTMNAGGVAVYVKMSIRCKFKCKNFTQEVTVTNTEGERLAREENGEQDLNYENEYTNSETRNGLVTSKVEYVFIEIFNNNQKLLLGTVYRPNKHINMNPFLDELKDLCLRYTDVILTGDFNVNILVDKSLMEDMSSIGLKIVNSLIPTHFASTTSTLLDIC